MLCDDTVRLRLRDATAQYRGGQSATLSTSISTTILILHLAFTPLSTATQVFMSGTSGTYCTVQVHRYCAYGNHSVLVTDNESKKKRKRASVERSIAVRKSAIDWPMSRYRYKGFLSCSSSHSSWIMSRCVFHSVIIRHHVSSNCK